jgi:large subunit ribosomal protein L21
MYAVINAGGKQERVEIGELVDVELLDALPGDELNLTPLLVVDGDEVTTSADALAAKSVTATVIGEVKGPKIVGFTYKSKTRQRRHYGHRQRYTTLEITAIGGTGSQSESDSVAVESASVALESDSDTGDIASATVKD